MEFRRKTRFSFECTPRCGGYSFRVSRAFSKGKCSNPIEKMWSKVKQLLRDLKARTHEELYAVVAKALSMITQDDAQGWFESCGYGKI